MGGIYEGTDLADKTFYGFKLNAASGNLTIDIINSDNPEDVVVIPDPDNRHDNDYQHWFWSQDTIRFSFNSNGHLLMQFI